VSGTPVTKTYFTTSTVVDVVPTTIEEYTTLYTTAYSTVEEYTTTYCPVTYYTTVSASSTIVVPVTLTSTIVLKSTYYTTSTYAAPTTKYTVTIPVTEISSTEATLGKLSLIPSSINCRELTSYKSPPFQRRRLQQQL
jgi:hypothetical protein